MPETGPSWLPLIGLAQAQPGKAQTGAVLLLIGIVIVLVLVGGIVMLLIRQRTIAQLDDAAGASSLLEQMRRLREEGKLSDEEFDAAKARLGQRISGGATPKGVARLRARAPSLRAPAPDATAAQIAPPGFDLTGAPLPKPPPARPPGGQGG